MYSQKFAKFLAALLIGVALLQQTALSAPAESSDKFAPLQFVPGQAIVKFKNPGRPADVVGSTRLSDRIFLVELPEAAPDLAADPEGATWRLIENLLRRNDVEYAHPDWIFELALHPTNDTHFNLQWNLSPPNIPEAWHVTPGSPVVRIAILDTGRTAHSDINWHPTLKYPTTDADDTSDWRHGTHVASIAGGIIDNSKGIAGVCPECELIPVRVTPKGSSSPTLSLIISGINWAKGNAEIMNMSFEAGYPCSHSQMQGLRDAIAGAIAAGVHIAAAAGNQSEDAANTSPASCTDVIAVAATDQNDALADYSNFGAVSVAAPGGGGNYDGSPPWSGHGDDINCPADPKSAFNAYSFGVPAAWTTSPGSGNTHCYRYLSGTSMAAPHVAGTLGLMVTMNPSIAPQTAKFILEDTAQPLAQCSQCGAGMIDAKAAVCFAAALSSDPLDPNSPPPPGC